MSTIARRISLTFVGCIVFFAFGFFSLFLYRSPALSSHRMETIRQRVDEYSRRAFIRKNPLFLFVNTTLLGNGDKYIYRPPRIVPANTFQGARAYEVFGMVSSWNPDTRTMEVNSYIGKHLFVRFDPTLDGSIAYVPLLDSTGAVADFREDDFVSDTSSNRFETLFCPGDIVSIRIDDPLEIKTASLTSPIVPKEIRLSHRLCAQ